MRWLLASVAAGVVLLLTFPVLASGSSEGPGKCQSLAGIRTLGNSETCDTLGSGVSLLVAVIVFVFIASGWKYFRARRQ